MISRTLIAAILTVTSSASFAHEDSVMMQAFIGSLKLDDQTAQWDEVGDGEVDVAFPSSIPSGGVEAEYTYGGTLLKWGINSGGSIAWKSSDTRISGGFSNETGGVIRVDIDNSLFLAELHLGGFVRGFLSQKVSLYAAAGPMIMYGKHEVEHEHLEPTANGELELTSSDESDFALGAYARAGIDFRYSQTQFFGLGLRYMKAEMDFEKTVGKLDLEGPQVVLTYTAWL